MSELKRTRSELIKTRKQIKIAKKGHELLKKKQDSLIMEFFTLLKEVQGKRKTLQETYTSALHAMNRARALQSDLHIKAVAIQAQERVPIELHVRNVAGVKIPEISSTHKTKSVVFESIMLQEVRLSYLDVLDKILELAAKETAVRTLLAEIKKTKRRSNALEKVRIPRLKNAVGQIQFELEERAREEFVRLKKMKT